MKHIKKIRLGIILILVVLLLVNLPDEKPYEDVELRDPYGYVKRLASDYLLGQLIGVRDIRSSQAKTYYLFDQDLYIKSEQDLVRIHNDHKIIAYDLDESNDLISYTIKAENLSYLYIYDDKLNMFFECDENQEVLDLALLDSEHLLVLMAESGQEALYKFSLTTRAFDLLYHPLENEAFLKLDSHNRDYIGMQIRVKKENTDAFHDVMVHLEKNTLDTEFWYRDKVLESVKSVDNFEGFMTDEFEVLSSNEDFSVYRLSWDTIGLDIKGQKMIIDDYAFSIQLSPDKSKLSVVSGEQDAWSGMYVYDLISGSKTLAVDGYGTHAPKEAIWIDDDRLLFVYGYAGGHFSMGGSLYEYSLKNHEKRLVRLSGQRSELFGLRLREDMIEVSKRTHNEAYNRSIIDSFLIDKSYEEIEEDPSVLKDIFLDFANDTEETSRYFIVYDIINDRRLISSMDGYLPHEDASSTLQLLLALIGLEEGVIDREDSLIKRDGKEYKLDDWMTDHTLSSALDNAVEWYFSSLAKELGPDKILTYIKRDKVLSDKLMDRSGVLKEFWSEAIVMSGHDQVDFLTSLLKNELKFSEENLDYVKELLVEENKDDYVLSATSAKAKDFNQRDVVWHSGYLTKGQDVYVFSTMLVGNKINENRAKTYTRDQLRALGLLN